MDKKGVKSKDPSKLSTDALCNEETCSCRLLNDSDFYKARKYRPSPGALALEDWRQNPFIWLHYVQSNDGTQLADFVLRADDTSHWSIHDVQRYFCGQLHCENVLFPCQYPNLSLPTPLGRHLWRTHAAHKRPPATYLKEFHRSLAIGLKKMEIEQAQMNRLIVYDQLIKIDLMDHYRRKMFFTSLLNILSFQDSLQLVSFENLQSTRLEGVRLIQQLACFNSHSLKYLFLWYFVRKDENPLLQLCNVMTTLINIVNMSTDEDKARLLKLLQDLEVPESRLPERCQVVLKDLEQNISQENEIVNGAMDVPHDNPYVPDKELIEENERKLRELLLEEKRIKTEPIEEGPNTDPKRPWRTNSSKEKLLRIDCDLKRHLGRATELIEPLPEGDMQRLVMSCRDHTKKAPSVGADRLRETVDEARRNLPNFQYRKVDNTTATAICPEAHNTQTNEENCRDGTDAL